MDTSAPITKLAFQTADGWFSLLPDATASVSMVAGTGRIDVQHGANAYVLRSALVPQTPPVVTLPAPTPPVTVPAQPSTGYDLDVTCGPGQRYPDIETALDALGAVAEAKGSGTDPTYCTWRLGVDPRGSYERLRPNHNPYAGYWRGKFDLYALPMPGGSRRMVEMQFAGGGGGSTGKAPLVPQSCAFRVSGFHLSADAPVGNMAGIRSEEAPPNGHVGALDGTIEDCKFAGWGMGVLLATPGGGKLVMRRSEFEKCGGDSGTVHNVYIGQYDEVLAEDIYSHETIVGHLFKCRAKKLTIRRMRLFDLEAGSSSYALNYAEGGILDIEDLTIHRGKNARNGPAITFWEDELFNAHPDGRPCSIRSRNLTVVSESLTTTGFGGTLGMWHRFGPGCPIDMQGTRFFGVAAEYKRGDVAPVAWPGDVTVLPAMPVLDLSSPVFGGGK